MCRTLFVVNKLMLGSRELGWELWDGKGILEQTSKQIKDTIKSGERVYGLIVGKSGELDLQSSWASTGRITMRKPPPVRN